MPLISKARFNGVRIKGAFLARIGMLAASVMATPAAAATFDGAWSVQIASDRASCGSGASVSIGISNGQIASTNSMVSASGRVAEAGAISVSLKSGLKSAIGSGRLAGAAGSGTWHGTLCSGTWTAQRI